MYQLLDIKTLTPEGETLGQRVQSYVRTKHLFFIVAQGLCRNLPEADLDDQTLDSYLSAFGACDFSRVVCAGFRPCPPFMAARTEKKTGTARVEFLLDLTREAEGGKASRFYSKILGALATQFFAAQPAILRLWFPFELEDTVGRGIEVVPAPGGAEIVKIGR